jgi:hypothetical protein
VEQALQALELGQIERAMALLKEVLQGGRLGDGGAAQREPDAGWDPEGALAPDDQGGRRRDGSG